jgi:hypothetical protein
MAGVSDETGEDLAPATAQPRRRVAIRLAALTAGLVVVRSAIVALQELGMPPGMVVADIVTAKSPPPFYVTIDGADNIQVRATATGRVTDRVRPAGCCSGSPVGSTRRCRRS